MINLSGKWVSSFIQNNKIYNEEVTFKQKDNKISANIFLNFDGEICKYHFKGTINKNIINGIYENLDDCDIESGTISLKIINDDFLYGVTTYISSDRNNDDIVQSPYALFRNTPNNLGTFNLCHNCVNVRATCCSNPSVDSPMLLPNKASEIAKLTKTEINDFAEQIDFGLMHKDDSLKSLYQMKKKNNACIFYKKCKCGIYNIRPIDCRIFPYDIKLENDGNYYLVYYVPSHCEIKNENINDIKMVSYNTRLFLRLLLPYLREWTDNYCSKALTKNENYHIICKLEDLF